ncbi:ABSCISIC ACID-INSENSITIVE 5-like protein 3, partial [Vigna umbellata]|uniref:ABSCISIC ACID-INSENSITIVE 5-like protein 3 n=1 Tax=Vigna umbellata TaxID=87088 RepID=UPI001F5F3D10
MNNCLLGKPVSSMNLDELLKTVYTVEENHSTKAGVVVEAFSTVVNPQQPQYQIPQQGLMGIYMTGQNIAQSLHTRATATSQDKTFERRQKRMIKNRESAARSRARKQ